MSTAAANCAGSQRRRRRQVVGEVAGGCRRGRGAAGSAGGRLAAAAAASWAAAICRPHSVANPKPTTQAERMCSSSAASSGESPASWKMRSMPGGALAGAGRVGAAARDDRDRVGVALHQPVQREPHAAHLLAPVRRRPVAARRRSAAGRALRRRHLPPELLGDAGQDGVLVRQLPVDGDGLDAQVVRQPAHGQGVEPVLVDHDERGVDDRLRRHRSRPSLASSLRSLILGSSSQPRPLVREKVLTRRCKHCYGNDVTVTLLPRDGTANADTAQRPGGTP